MTAVGTLRSPGLVGFHVVDGIEAAVAMAQEFAGDRTVEVAARDVGRKVLAADLVDEVSERVRVRRLADACYTVGHVPPQPGHRRGDRRPE